jgi:hypothetical protein
MAALGLLLLSQGAQAGFTSWLPSANEPNLDEILDNLYGLSNLVRINDDGIGETDILWANSGAAVSAKAKFTTDRQAFGFLPGASGMGYENIFTARDYGYLSGLSGSIDPILSGSVFRFATRPRTDLIWSSDPMNNDGGSDQMITYRIIGSSGRADNQVGAYVLAWEQDNWLGDRDYNDLIVEVSGVSPVPEPATLALLGLGLAGLTGWRVRRRKLQS